MAEHDPLAIVLVGFGSPADFTKLRPFLYQIFSDPLASPLWGSMGILAVPAAHALAYVAARRSRLRYLSVSGMHSSRQLVNDLSTRLEQELKEKGREEVRVFPAMRYGDPSLADVLSGVAAAGIHDVLVVPLFPHRARATIGSIEAEVSRICMKPPCYELRTAVAGPWYQHSEFVMAWVDAIRGALRAFPIAIRDRVHLLFSAHAVPAGPVDYHSKSYSEQIVESAELINYSLGRILPMSVAYQSAGAWGEWTEPTLEDQLTMLGISNVRDCLIAPISFVYDNVETWCDIDLDIIPYAKRYHMERIMRVVPPLASPRLVGALASLVR